MSKKKKRPEPIADIDQDENFAFIAGYTPGGIPYGITWAEQAEIDRREKEGLMPTDEEPEGVDYSPEEAGGHPVGISFTDVGIEDLPF